MRTSRTGTITGTGIINTGNIEIRVLPLDGRQRCQTKEGVAHDIVAAPNSLRIFWGLAMNSHNWIDRYPRLLEEAPRLKGTAVLDAEVMMKRASRNSTPCISARPTNLPSLVRSTGAQR